MGKRELLQMESIRTSARNYAVSKLETGLRWLNRFDIGTTVWERDGWEVLIILDACRRDIVDEVDHPVLSDATVSGHTSVASFSLEFMEKHFTSKYREEMEDTALVVANPFSEKFDLDEFAYVDETWRYAWSEEEGTVWPEPVVDRAIDTWRARDEHGANRMIVWLMQPHRPFNTRPDLAVPIELSEFGETGDVTTLWDEIELGEIDQEEIWKAYNNNLEYVLESVDTIVEDLDADIVVTSDHGNAFGEWGFWGHPKYLPLPVLRRVPWIEIQGRGNQSYEPEINHEEDLEESISDGDAKERLKSLGYLGDYE